MKQPRIAILGAGIMGVSLALMLARRHCHVILFDKSRAPLMAASRWNEGKIHLGFLYSADRTLNTARQVLTGGLHFRPLIEELIHSDIERALTPFDDIYLCHRDSVVGAEHMRDYFQRVASLVRGHPDARNYCRDARQCEVSSLSPAQLERVCDTDQVVAGFSVPECSVSTGFIADRLEAAMEAQEGIETLFGRQVERVRPREQAKGKQGWLVMAEGEEHGPYDYVVNALWQGRLQIDDSLGLSLPRRWSHRYRQSLFLHTKTALSHPNTVIATGPFGDIKNYDGYHFYLSWYPAGLLAESDKVMPEMPPGGLMDKDERVTLILDSLQNILPGVAGIRSELESIRLEGGWVYASADGSLADPEAAIHRRSDFGISRHGHYFSVDTGKYSTAPWLAVKLADMIRPLS